MTLFCHKIISL